MTLEHINKMFPNFEQGFRKAAELFGKIRSFEDIEIHLLRGRGLSPNTYKSYLAAVKQLYSFTDGLNPFQITPGHIEKFYDDLRTRVALPTCYSRMIGLKKFFRCIAEQAPCFVSPFEIMTEKLTAKLNKTKQKVTKAALTKSEMNKLLAWLSTRTDPLGKLAYSAIFMLSTTGLRATELCNLRWTDIEQIEGTYYANGIGKGDKEFHQELYKPAVGSIYRDGEYLFTRLDDDRPLDQHALWYVIQKIGDEAKQTGIIAENRKVDFSPHLFRRTYATLLYRNGMRIKAIAEQTRHASIDTLIKHYIDDSEPTTPILDKIFKVA